MLDKHAVDHVEVQQMRLVWVVMIDSDSAKRGKEFVYYNKAADE